MKQTVEFSNLAGTNKMDLSHTFFGSFNAKHLNAEEVANTFVPHDKYWRLLNLQHSLLIGPRGSGKTTLLKMLQPKAMAAWSHEQADRARQAISFTSVFVPADISWQAQISASMDNLPEVIREDFQLAVFVTHVQAALVATFLQLTYDRPKKDNDFQRLVISRDIEVNISKEIANSWGLQLSVPSFLGLRKALTDRLRKLSDLPFSSDEIASKTLSIAQKTLIPSILQALEVFNNQISDFDRRWAFLFDELEIAPISVQVELFRALRSTDRRLIFKLAISPATPAAEILMNAYGPSAGNDFEEIPLYSEGKETVSFCFELWKNLTYMTSAENLTPEAVLGRSYFHDPETNKQKYGPKGIWQAAFKELSIKDQSFAILLRKKGIQPNALDSTPRKTMDAVVRKIAPIVGFRNQYLKSGPRLKPYAPAELHGKRSGSQVYSGWDALCLISEGNPRWFIGMAKRLLAEREIQGREKYLSRNDQYRVVSEASEKFLAFVSTMPTQSSTSGKEFPGGLRQLVEALATAFRFEVLEREFALDPAISFTVDACCSPEILSLITTGLYSGAFVPVEEIGEQSVFATVIGRRLRLTYLLAPEERLPLRSGKARSLLELTRRVNRTQKNPNTNSSEAVPQRGLFDD